MAATVPPWGGSRNQPGRKKTGKFSTTEPTTTVTIQDRSANKKTVTTDKRKYSKDGREDLKEAALKGQSWKGKQALKRQAQESQSKGSSDANAGPSQGRPARSGFQVGPQLAKGAYTGKFKRIKAGLIQNAKLKQQYAKMLKREGPAATDGDASTDVEMDSDERDNQEPLAEDAEMATSPARKRAKGKGRMRDPDEMQEDGPRPVIRKRKSSELEREEPDSDDNDGPAPGPDNNEEMSTDQSARQVHPSRRNKTDTSPLKKKPRLSEDQIEEKRKQRHEDKQTWGKKNRRGQPNLGGRMNVLLWKIERSISRS